MQLRRWTLKMSVAVGCAAAGAATVALLSAGGARPGHMPEGVRVAGLPLGGVRLEAARHALARWRDDRIAEPLCLALDRPGAPGRTWSPTRGRLGFDIDTELTLQAAVQAGLREPPLRRLLRRIGRGAVVSVTPTWRVDPARVERYVTQRVAPVVAQPARDARLLVSGDGFSVLPERDGLGIDVKAAVEGIVASGQQVRPTRVALQMRTVKPRVTAASLSSIDGEIARFSTHFSERGNRSRNIELACERINGLVLAPGATFSYNEVVGPRDSEAGFRTAPVIVRGRLEPGLGGGVCQTSSTLYNAVLLADLEIVQRSHHGFPVHYVPAGRDATVAYGSIDFRFRNNTDAPVAIYASGSGGRVAMRLYGKRVPGRQVRIERAGVSSWSGGANTVRDPSLPSGSRRVVERGRSGHRATVWRIVTVNGRETKREVVSRDTYRAFPAVVAVGTGAPSAQPAGAGTSQARLPVRTDLDATGGTPGGARTGPEAVPGGESTDQ